MSKRRVYFVINLLQDVNILRPLIHLAVHERGLDCQILVTEFFLKRDITNVWRSEVQALEVTTGNPVQTFSDAAGGLTLLSGGSGLVIAGSESSLGAHRPVNDLFRALPAKFLSVTLQHGFECVGFKQSRDQNLAHGDKVLFNAQVLCGWAPVEHLESLVRSQRHKLVVTGPSFLLQPASPNPIVLPQGLGLVCENAHSPRFHAGGDFKVGFFEAFESFCAALAARGDQVALRPHPGGQYTIKQNLVIPPNVRLVNQPIYQLDLRKFAWAISPPSSVLIDLIVAGVPVAVWHDKDQVMDVGNYEGLPRVSGTDDWLAFIEQVAVARINILANQRRFLRKHGLELDRARVKSAFTAVLSLVDDIDGTREPTAASVRRERLLFIVPDLIPTFQLSFVKPLDAMLSRGDAAMEVISEIHLNAMFGGYKPAAKDPKALAWLKARIDAFDPTVAIFCRYAGSWAVPMAAHLKSRGTPTIYHIDDDLLNIPRIVDERKWQFHNRKERLAAVRGLLHEVNLVYCSTRRLMERMRSYGFRTPMVAGDIYCASMPIAEPVRTPVRKVGFMGIGHEADLRAIVPALKRYLARYCHVELELFGTVPVPAELLEFGDRVKQAPKVDNYENFLRALASYGWDIGICPLIDIEFNLLKANTKWVEYTAVGAAVVASRGTVYDACCADGCGILADSEEEWFSALSRLTEEADTRYALVAAAQAKLRRDYSVKQLRDQVLCVVKRAQAEVAGYADTLLPWRRSARALGPERILYVCNSWLPTLQLSFIKPLRLLETEGVVHSDVLLGDDFKTRRWESEGFQRPLDWIAERFARVKPTVVVFCRYSGPHATAILTLAEDAGVPVLYHIDDDLLGVPRDIGEEKYHFHNQQSRLDTVRLLLNRVDLVYCSTRKLYAHLTEQEFAAPITYGDIYCSGEVIRQPAVNATCKIGYMASADHAHNLNLVVGALVRTLRKHPHVVFEFFGSIRVPPELREFGSRISHAPRIDNYEEFLTTFASLGWDIGICPLTNIHFNQMKADTKWVEYTSVGAAVVASRGLVYDDCCADGCGLLVETEDDWFAALDSLVGSPMERVRVVTRAQAKLRDNYSVEALRAQVLDKLDKCREAFVQRIKSENILKISIH